MRNVISSLRGAVFTGKFAAFLAGAAILCLLFVAPYAMSTVPGTSDEGSWDAKGVETGLGPAPFFNHQGSGADFVKVGATTRVYNILTGVPQTEPFVVTVPALPAGAVVIETFVSWNYLLNGTPPATDAISLNGNPVTGTLAGSGSPDLCWGKDGAASYLASGVTSFVSPGPAPAAVTVAGATDKPVGTDSNAYGEGLTILVVYQVPGDPSRNVDLYRGYASNTTGTVAWTAAARLNFTVQYEDGDFHFFVNGLDGQTAGDDFFIEGVNRSGAVNGTVAVGDAWQGLLGPSPVDNLYDHANDDISAYLTPPAAKLDISTVGIVELDCVGHSFAAVSFPAGPEIPTLGEWGLIIFGVLLLGFITWVFLRRKKVIGVRT